MENPAASLEGDAAEARTTALEEVDYSDGSDNEEGAKGGADTAGSDKGSDKGSDNEAADQPQTADEEMKDADEAKDGEEAKGGDDDKEDKPERKRGRINLSRTQIWRLVREALEEGKDNAELSLDDIGQGQDVASSALVDALQEAGLRLKLRVPLGDDRASVVEAAAQRSRPPQGPVLSVRGVPPGTTVAGIRAMMGSVGPEPEDVEPAAVRRARSGRGAGAKAGGGPKTPKAFFVWYKNNEEAAKALKAARTSDDFTAVIDSTPGKPCGTVRVAGPGAEGELRRAGAVAVSARAAPARGRGGGRGSGKQIAVGRFASDKDARAVVDKFYFPKGPVKARYASPRERDDLRRADRADGERTSSGRVLGPASGSGSGGGSTVLRIANVESDAAHARVITELSRQGAFTVLNYSRGELEIQVDSGRIADRVRDALDDRMFGDARRPILVSGGGRGRGGRGDRGRASARRRSPSPRGARRRSRSRSRSRSWSPRGRRASPPRGRWSPPRGRSPSPRGRRSPSPRGRRSPSPRGRRSPSPRGRRSPSPRGRSPPRSPRGRSRSRSPPRGGRRSPSPRGGRRSRSRSWSPRGPRGRSRSRSWSPRGPRGGPPPGPPGGRAPPPPPAADPRR